LNQCFLVRDTDLDLNFEPNAEFVLDVLGRAKALEDPALDHDAHLGAQEFSFLHQM